MYTPDTRSLLRLLLSSGHESSTLLLAQIAFCLLVLLNLLSLLLSWYAMPILLGTLFLIFLFAIINLLYVFLREELLEDQFGNGKQYTDLIGQFDAFQHLVETMHTDVIDTYEQATETHRLLLLQQERQKEREKYTPKSKRKIAPKTVILEVVTVQEGEAPHDEEEQQSA